MQVEPFELTRHTLAEELVLVSGRPVVDGLSGSFEIRSRTVTHGFMPPLGGLECVEAGRSIFPTREPMTIARGRR